MSLKVKTHQTLPTASYLDLHLELDNGRMLYTRYLLYDKRDYFNFPMANFPFMGSKILAATAYDVYISQLIRFTRGRFSYSSQNWVHDTKTAQTRICCSSVEFTTPEVLRSTTQSCRPELNIRFTDED